MLLNINFCFSYLVLAEPAQDDTVDTTSEETVGVDSEEVAPPPEDPASIEEPAVGEEQDSQWQQLQQSPAVSICVCVYTSSFV